MHYCLYCRKFIWNPFREIHPQCEKAAEQIENDMDNFEKLARQKPLEKTPEGFRKFIDSMDIDAAVEKSIEALKTGRLDSRIAALQDFEDLRVAITKAETIGNGPENEIKSIVFGQLSGFCNQKDELCNDYTFYEWSAYTMTMIDMWLYQVGSENRQTIMSNLLNPLLACFEQSVDKMTDEKFNAKMFFYSQGFTEDSPGIQRIVNAIGQTWGGRPSNGILDINENIDIFDDFEINSVVVEWLKHNMEPLINCISYVNDNMP